MPGLVRFLIAWLLCSTAFAVGWAVPPERAPWPLKIAAAGVLVAIAIALGGGLLPDAALR